MYGVTVQALPPSRSCVEAPKYSLWRLPCANVELRVSAELSAWFSRMKTPPVTHVRMYTLLIRCRPVFVRPVGCAEAAFEAACAFERAAAPSQGRPSRGSVKRQVSFLCFSLLESVVSVSFARLYFWRSVGTYIEVGMYRIRKSRVHSCRNDRKECGIVGHLDRKPRVISTAKKRCLRRRKGILQLRPLGPKKKRASPA